MKPTSLYEFGGGEDVVRRIQTPLATHFRGHSPVLDIGCGDWQFSKLMDWSEYYYTGIDCVPSLIDTNTKDYFTQLNSAIDNQYKSAFNFRLGGELKFNTLMFRLGGAYYGNPYKDEKANRMKLAGGLGYRNKGIFVDLTYVYAMNKDVNYPYRLNDNFFQSALVKNNRGNIVATVGFKL